MKKSLRHMKSANRKQVLDLFSERLQCNFADHCQEYQVPFKIDHFITYLIDRELIRATAIKRYVILETFEELNNKGDLKKTNCVNAIADRFNISQRSVWNILRSKK